MRIKFWLSFKLVIVIKYWFVCGIKLVFKKSLILSVDLSCFNWCSFSHLFHRCTQVINRCKIYTRLVGFEFRAPFRAWSLNWIKFQLVFINRCCDCQRSKSKMICCFLKADTRMLHALFTYPCCDDFWLKLQCLMDMRTKMNSPQ